MNESTNNIANTGISILAILLGCVVALAIYVFICACYKRICGKCGVSPGVMIWIPIAQLVPLLQIAKMPVWMLILFIIPVVNVFVFLTMWFKICEALGKSGWLVLLFLVPIANIILIPYLAFSE